jgi:hypothetical protein
VRRIFRLYKPIGQLEPADVRLILRNAERDLKAVQSHYALEILAPDVNEGIEMVVDEIRRMAAGNGADRVVIEGANG